MKISSVDYYELLKTDTLQDVILNFDLTYMQYRMLDNEMRNYYINNKEVCLEFAIQYCRDNKNIMPFIKRSMYEVINDITVLSNLIEESPNEFNDYDWTIIINKIYNSYVTRMLNSTATNWNINDYIYFIHLLEKYYNFNQDLWDVTSKVLYKSNELMGDSFNNKKFYVMYIKPHLNELILPHHLNQIEVFINTEDKKQLLNELLKSDNNLKGYYINEEIINKLKIFKNNC